MNIKNESNSDIHSIFSIVLSLYLVYNLVPAVHDDLRTLVTVTAFVASVLFATLRWLCPDERIPESLLRWKLERSENLFRFAIQTEILFKGWECSHYALTHDWKEKLYDKMNALPASPAFVPSSAPSRAFYIIILTPAVANGFFTADFFTVAFSLGIGMLFSTFFILSSSIIVWDIFRFLTELGILQDYLEATETFQKSRRILPLAIVEYTHPRDAKRGKRDGVPRTKCRVEFDTVTELYTNFCEMVVARNWRRFGSSFMLFEILFSQYAEGLIPRQMHDDLVITWSGCFSPPHIKEQSVHRLGRLYEAYLYYKHSFQKDLTIPNRDDFMKSIDDPLAFFKFLQIPEMNNEGFEAVARMLNTFATGRDVRVEKMLEILLAKLDAHSAELVQLYIDRLCFSFSKYSDEELEFIFGGFFESVKDKTSHKESMMLLRKTLAEPDDEGKLRSVLRELVAKHVVESLEPDLANKQWNAIRQNLDDLRTPLKPLYKSLIEIIEIIEPNHSEDIFEFLLVNLPCEMWDQAGVKISIMTVSRHKSTPTKESERAIVEILKSGKPAVRLETASLVSRLGDTATHSVVRALVDCLFLQDELIRVAAATSLVKLSRQIDRKSVEYQRMMNALNDPSPMVRKAIETLRA